MTTTSSAAPFSLTDHVANLSQDGPKINWIVIVPVTLISAVVLLVGLPLGAVLIVNYSGCCLANGTEQVVTFWAAMIAGFLALFGMVVTGVFVITAFRVDATARAKAQLSAREEVWTYIEQYRDKLFKELGELEELAPRVKQAGEETMQAMANARDEVEAQQREASNAITRAQTETTDAARQAQDAIGEALGEIADAAGEAQREIGEVRDQTIGAVNQAQEAIVGAQQDVERLRTEAISAIDRARQEVEAAAQAAQGRIDRAEDAPEGEGGSD